MNVLKRASALILCLILLASSSALAATKKQKDEEEVVLRQITREVVEDIPETIQNVLDLAYEQLNEVNGKNLGQKNKFTKWRNDYPYGWCGGFITWCMLQFDMPQQ